jgi:hypothetical protein
MIPFDGFPGEPQSQIMHLNIERIKTVTKDNF